MKLAVVFAAVALAATAATAAEPPSVVGDWSPQKLTGVVGMPMLRFTASGQVFSVPRYAVVQRFIGPLEPGAKPPPLPTPPQVWMGRYEAQGDKVVVRLDARTSTTFELTKDGRLCIFPGPGFMRTDGVVRPQGGERQCYERQSVERS